MIDSTIQNCAQNATSDQSMLCLLTGISDQNVVMVKISLKRKWTYPNVRIDKPTTQKGLTRVVRQMLVTRAQLFKASLA